LFQNLISNAVKFHRPEEPPRVRIFSRAQAGWCEIYVEDNGIGFDERHSERIFTPFERLHGRGKYDGVGMGLAICRKIAERHGGRITAKSTPGKGSIFIVTLPLKQKAPS
jgi:signal transduction histidine kinase